MLVSGWSYLRALILGAIYVALVVAAVAIDLPWWVRVLLAAVAAVGLFGAADFVLHARRWRIDGEWVFVPSAGSLDRTVAVDDLRTASLRNGRFDSTFVLEDADDDGCDDKGSELRVNALVSARDVRRWHREM